MDLYKNIKHSCTFADLRHLCVRDSLLCVFICSKISINSNGWLGHLIGSVNCDVTGPLWRHQKAVSCLGWDKSISDTRRSSRTPGCTRQIDLRPPTLVSYASMYETKWSHGHLIFNLGIPIPGKMVFILRWGPDFFFFFFVLSVGKLVCGYLRASVTSSTILNTLLLWCYCDGCIHDCGRGSLGQDASVSMTDMIKLQGCWICIHWVTVKNLNSLRPSDAIWRHTSGSTLAQVMACCLTAPSHYLNQCWLSYHQ